MRQNLLKKTQDSWAARILHQTRINFNFPVGRVVITSHMFSVVLCRRDLVMMSLPSFSGVYAGIKFFIIDFIFKSCPKLRQRYDTPYIIWTNLPTDLQLKERSNPTLSRRVSPVSHIQLFPCAELRPTLSSDTHRVRGVTSLSCFYSSLSAVWVWAGRICWVCVGFTECRG